MGNPNKPLILHVACQYDSAILGVLSLHIPDMKVGVRAKIKASGSFGFGAGLGPLAFLR